MSETQQNKPPMWFWVVSALALLWNLLGVFAYVQQVTLSPEALGAMEPAERALYESAPAWATGAFALAVFGGALGCVFLLLRNKLAAPIFMASLAGVIIQMFYNFFMAKTMEVYGPGSTIMPIMVVVIAIALIWFAKRATHKNWLK